MTLLLVDNIPTLVAERFFVFLMERRIRDALLAVIAGEAVLVVVLVKGRESRTRVEILGAFTAFVGHGKRSAMWLINDPAGISGIHQCQKQQMTGRRRPAIYPHADHTE